MMKYLKHLFIIMNKKSIFFAKKMVNSKLMRVTDDFLARINLQNTYGKLMLKIKKMNENKVGLDGTGFQELNLKNGDIELTQ